MVMGCSASRQHNLAFDPSSSSKITSIPKTVNLHTPLVHHPPLKKGDTQHLVSLTSTSYGSLVVIDPPSPSSSLPHSYDDSIINTWELMAGLDDLDLSSVIKPSVPVNSKTPIQSHLDGKNESSVINNFDTKNIFYSTSISKVSNDVIKSPPQEEMPVETKPLWQHLSEELLLADMDPNVGSSFRKAQCSRKLGFNLQNDIGSSRVREPQPQPQPRSPSPSPASAYTNKIKKLKVGVADTNEENRIVIYYTSLRGIQKTYENCCAVRTIFKGFRVPVDERDVSMDSSYKKELETALVDCGHHLGGENGIDYNKKTVVMSLPQVFIRGKYVGEAEEIKQLHETGELAKLLHGLPVGGSSGSVCESCGDARFLPCLNCNGSQKVFEEKEGQITRCPHCNENGLIRCPICCWPQRSLPQSDMEVSGWFKK